MSSTHEGYALGTYTIEELQAEIDNRAMLNRLTGELVFEFAGRAKAERWVSVGIPALAAAGDEGTFTVDEIQVEADHSVTAMFSYTTIGASKTDVARFCARTIASVLTDSGNQRLHPNGFSVQVYDLTKVLGRRIRVHPTT